MRALYWRIYLTVVLVLAAFALGAAWLFHQQMEQERGSADAAASERLQAMAVLIHRALPPVSAPRDEQAQALNAWSQRLRMPLALLDEQGRRMAASEIFERREDDPGARLVPVTLEDGRQLVFLRPSRFLLPREGGPRAGLAGAPPRGPGLHRPEGPSLAPLLGNLWSGQTLAILLLLLFVGVAAGAYPVVRRLTRRLEALKRGVEQFGQGQLGHRVEVNGSDEVAALARSFNRSAEQVEQLLRSHKSLLANASHELRSPLARLKMAFAMLDEASDAQRARLRQEIDTNVRELDALVEEVLLASRLEADGQDLQLQPLDLSALLAEEAGRVQAQLEDKSLSAAPGRLAVWADERLLRRALRNLLENARRYGGDEVLLQCDLATTGVVLRVCDRGPGVPQPLRERIFEPFFRLPGHAEQAGGVGLGLSLVRQIVLRHGGTVHCEDRPGGGSCFVLSLPWGPPSPQA